MVRTLLCGGVVGTAAGAAVGALAWGSGQLPPLHVLGAGLAAAAVVAAAWWGLALALAARRRWREWRYRRRIRAWRRRELAEASALRRGDDEVTTPLDASPRPPPDRERNRALLADARAALDRSDHHGAIAALTRLVELAPAHSEGWILRGRVHGDLGDFDRALADLARAEQLTPYDPAPVVAMGEVCFARKDYVRAASYYDVALMLDPKDAAVWERRGLAHLHRSCFEMAAEDFRAALRLDRDLPYAAANLAQAERKLHAATGPVKVPKKVPAARTREYAAPPRRW